MNYPMTERELSNTGLSGTSVFMAFLAGGNTPGRGEYGQHISRCIGYILKAADDSGFVSLREYTSHGPMYDHGFATLFLAEIYGMSPDSEVRQKLERIRPGTLGQAARIEGMTPAALTLVLAHVKGAQKTKAARV